MELQVCDVAETLEANLAVAWQRRLDGREIDDLTSFERLKSHMELTKAAEALTKRMVGPDAWQRFTNDRAMDMRRTENRGEKDDFLFGRDGRSSKRKKAQLPF